MLTKNDIAVMYREFADEYIFPYRPWYNIDTSINLAQSVYEAYASKGTPEIGLNILVEDLIYIHGAVTSAFSARSDPKILLWDLYPDPAPVINSMYRDLPQSERNAIIDAINSGQVTYEQVLKATAVDLAGGSAANVIAEAQDWPVTGGGATPAPQPGEGDDEFAADFSIGLYIAAFGRAGEHEGVEYWANQLKSDMAAVGQSEGLKLLAGHMYHSGVINGEGGTDIVDTSAYVSYVYQNVLGREADSGGLTYWVGGIDSGSIPREQFLTTFLNSALQAQGDSSYLKARIDVAKHVAQESVSGPGKFIDLVGVLQGVTDAASAQARIASIDRGEFNLPGKMSAELSSDFDVSLWLAMDGASLDAEVYAQGELAESYAYDMPVEFDSGNADLLF